MSRILSTVHMLSGSGVPEQTGWYRKTERSEPGSTLYTSPCTNLHLDLCERQREPTPWRKDIKKAAGMTAGLGGELVLGLSKEGSKLVHLSASRGQCCIAE